MNIDTLAHRVAAVAGTTKGEARKTILIVFDQMAHAASGGETIHISQFGKFTVKDRAERQARNPRTGEPVAVPASKKVTFSAAKGFKSRLRG
ncbi:HU family DNA-binding protein [Sphingomonas sp. RHCKR7]|uniref:HU family DNA-binding protein n=1 Tax=Sphingomonas folli TaxID=2862497 RepID=UPI001C66E8BC|nr:HU family DNA-binding protein [Sphingomonas folli]MBW6528524.1 HU family DNA-binding protein [Sphingomonas folli]